MYKINAKETIKKIVCIEIFDDYFRNSMFIRNIQINRLIIQSNRYRFFSIKNIYFNKIENNESQNLTKTLAKDIQSNENHLPTIPQLPNYLPEPTGVKSKLFDDFYLVYRFGFYRAVRYIQILKLAQTLGT